MIKSAHFCLTKTPNFTNKVSEITSNFCTLNWKLLKKRSMTLGWENVSKTCSRYPHLVWTPVSCYVAITRACLWTCLLPISMIFLIITTSRSPSIDKCIMSVSLLGTRSMYSSLQPCGKMVIVRKSTRYLQTLLYYNLDILVFEYY